MNTHTPAFNRIYSKLGLWGKKGLNERHTELYVMVMLFSEATSCKVMNFTCLVFKMVVILLTK